MKLLKIISICLGLAAVSFIYLSCDKKTQEWVGIRTDDFTNMASVQVYNATLGTTRNYVYVDGVPVTGQPISYTSTFPSTPSNFSLVGGLHAFLIRDTLPAATQPPISFAEVLQAKSYYTLFMYDTVTSPKQKLVTNNIAIPTDTTCRIRFAHFAFSTAAIPAIDIFSWRRNANIFTNVNPTEVTGFIPFDSRNFDTLFVRLAGTTTNVLNKPTASTTIPFYIVVSPTRLRSYTLVLRGGWRTDLTTAATVRALSFFSNN